MELKGISSKYRRRIQSNTYFIYSCILVLQLGFFFANSTYRNTWNAYLVAQNVGSDTDFCVPKLDPSSDKIF